MRRNRPIWRPRLEGLETRLALSTVGPSPQEQYMLQLLNEARTNPAAAAERVTTNLSPDDLLTLQHYNVNIDQVKNTIANSAAQPPLAWNAQLSSAALQLNQDMNSSGVQAHNQPNGSTSDSRIAASGYTNTSSTGENAYAYAQSVDQAMKAFLIDWGVSDSGHRDHILQPGASADQAYRDVGLSVVSSTNSSMGPYLVTQDFGSQNGESAQVVGAVFNDPTGANFYEPGQGVGGVTIQRRQPPVRSVVEHTNLERWRLRVAAFSWFLSDRGDPERPDHWRAEGQRRDGERRGRLRLEQAVHANSRIKPASGSGAGSSCVGATARCNGFRRCGCEHANASPRPNANAGPATSASQSSASHASPRSHP